MAQKLELIIEKDGDNYGGRVYYDDNLIVDSADSVEELVQQLRPVALELHPEVGEDFEFELVYDVSTFFDQYPYINRTELAKVCGINPALMRHYAAGVKFPGSDRARLIEGAIHRIGKSLATVSLVATNHR